MRFVSRLGACAVLLCALWPPTRGLGADSPPPPPVCLAVWGTEGSEPGQFQAPGGVAVAPDGYVYVADALNHRIQAFTPDGTFVRQLGSPGSQPGQLILPLDVALDPDGNLLVADAGNFRIQRLSPSGEVLQVWGSGGYGDGEFAMPSSVCAVKSGHVFVADAATHTLQEFTAHGKFVARHGQNGVVMPGAFRGPRGLAADDDGSVWILDTINLRVQRLAPDGTFTWWELPGYGTTPTAYPTDLALGPDGTLYVLDARTFSVMRYARNGLSLEQWGSFGTDRGQFTKPTGIAVDAAGRVYVAESRVHRIQKFGPSPGG